MYLIFFMLYRQHLNVCAIDKKPLCMFLLATCSQRFLSAAVLSCRLSDVPRRQRQRFHFIQTVEFQHVHVITVHLISGNETAFSSFKYIFDDFLCAHFIFHAEKYCNPLTGHILRVFEKLGEKNIKKEN